MKHTSYSPAAIAKNIAQAAQRSAAVRDKVVTAHAQALGLQGMAAYFFAMGFHGVQCTFGGAVPSDVQQAYTMGREAREGGALSAQIAQELARAGALENS